jgi:hypothetical protein
MEYAENSITSVNAMYVGVVNRFAQCGDSYERGFMNGCLSVMGNDKEVCNLAEDA